jgi:hypothetical protein
MPMKKKTKKPGKSRSRRTQPRCGTTDPGLVSPYVWDQPAPKPALKPRRATPTMLTVRVELAGSEPAVWRRLELANDLTLEAVHGVLQGAMGWENAHLHRFEVPATEGERWASIVDELYADQGEVRETDVRIDEVLAEPDDVLVYEYDFGDSWIHVLRVESERDRGSDDPLAAVTDGERACPPEDVGGVYGYRHIVAALAGEIEPDEELEYLLEGLEGYDPDAFDLSRADSWVRRMLPARR